MLDIKQSIVYQVHRRLLNDDWFGVAEALNETAFGVGLVATGKHYVIAGNSQNTDGVWFFFLKVYIFLLIFNLCLEKSMSTKEKELAQKILMEPWVFFHSNVDTNSRTKKTIKDSVRIII